MVLRLHRLLRSPGQVNSLLPTDKELRLLSSFPFSSMMCQLSVVESKSATFPSEKARHLLDDSVLESRSPRRGLALTSSSAVTNGLSLGKRLRPAHDSGRATVRCVLRVCLCHCAAPGGPPPPAEAAPYRRGQSQRGLCFLVSWASPSALSAAGRWKEPPDARLRPAVIGW